jgi:hypothetical protein
MAILTSMPQKVTPEIAQACEYLSINKPPVFVPIVPDPNARANKCIFNVRAAAEEGRGAVVLGWKIFEWPGVLVQFVGHAVLRVVGDSLLCLTPDTHRDTRVLFAEDPRIRFDDSDPLARMPSRHVAVTHHTDAAEFIRAEEQIHALKSKLPPTSGAISLTHADATRLRHLESAQLMAIRDIALRTLSSTAPCICGRGRAFHACCRPGMLRSKLAERR